MPSPLSAGSDALVRTGELTRDEMLGGADRYPGRWAAAVVQAVRSRCSDQARTGRSAGSSNRTTRFCGSRSQRHVTLVPSAVGSKVP